MHVARNKLSFRVSKKLELRTNHIKEEAVKVEKDTKLSLHNAALIQIKCASST